MVGILALAGYELAGVAAVWRLVARRGPIVRIWLGMSLGLVMMMWFPALFAFIMDFTLTANLCALALAAALAVGAWLFAPAARRADPMEVNESAGSEIPWKLLLALVIPLALLGGYLQHTHTLREIDGALHVGQSTYGDLCLHLGIASGLVDAAFPPTYTLLPGAELGYPFLSDAMCASMLIFGSSLRCAFVVTGTLMMTLTFAGFAIFAWELTRSAFAVTIAYLIMFLNGGLGFMYVLDGAAADNSAFREVFTGFYCAPANMTEKNVRWVNVICDMLVPQRTLTAGWAVLMPALYMLLAAVREKRLGIFLCLGLWAGAMPMIHTHSFLALGLASAGAMAYCVLKAPGDRGQTAAMFCVYGAVAVALALPQLLKWTFPQTAGGGSLAIRLNWVNNNGDNTFIDGYFWFWIKNVGVTYLLMLPAALCAKPAGKALAWGALAIYLIAEIFQFQPNPYDNNKLFYVAYIIMTPMVGSFVAALWERLRGLNCRGLFLAGFMILATLSGMLSIGREVVSDYRLFSREEAGAGEYAASVEKDAVFLTGFHHNNPIPALGGKQLVCGTPTYLHFHGVDYSVERLHATLMLENPAENIPLFKMYGVDYVYVSSYERANFKVDEKYFIDNFETVYSEGDVAIYKFTEE